MKHLTIILAFLIALSSPVAAQDFAKGNAAYKTGDYATALKEWTPLAEAGNAAAQFNLALMYSDGRGVLQDYKEAVMWYTLAAEQGFARAQYNLGVMYRNGEYFPQNYLEAVKWYTLAAEQGFAQAQHSLGTMYSGGKGVLKDYEEAVKWYTLAAEQGLAEAQRNLEIFAKPYAQLLDAYNAGDYATAMNELKPLAEAGFAGPQNFLGIVYFQGKAVLQDYKEAAKWFTLAAEQGLAGAQANLGNMYSKGWGVSKNNIIAHMWSNISVVNGNNTDGVISDFRDKIAEDMTPEDISKAQAMARECMNSNYKNCGYE